MFTVSGRSAILQHLHYCVSAGKFANVSITIFKVGASLEVQECDCVKKNKLGLETEARVSPG